MLPVQGRRFENQCDRGKSPSPGELGGDGTEPGLELPGKGSCRRCLDLRLQGLRQCSEPLEWTEEDNGERGQGQGHFSLPPALSRPLCNPSS